MRRELWAGSAPCNCWSATQSWSACSECRCRATRAILCSEICRHRRALLFHPGWSLAGLNHVSWRLDILGDGVRGWELRLLDKPSASENGRRQHGELGKRAHAEWGALSRCPAGSRQMAGLLALLYPQFGEVLNFCDDDGSRALAPDSSGVDTHHRAVRGWHPSNLD